MGREARAQTVRSTLDHGSNTPSIDTGGKKEETGQFWVFGQKAKEKTRPRGRGESPKAQPTCKALSKPAPIYLYSLLLVLKCFSSSSHS